MGLGNLKIQPNHFHVAIAGESPGSPTSPGLSQHQAAAQESKLLPAETSRAKAAGGEAGGTTAQRQETPNHLLPCTGAPWTAASLVTCGYCYSPTSETAGKGWLK